MAKRRNLSGSVTAMNARRNAEAREKYVSAAEKLHKRAIDTGSMYIPGEDLYYGRELPEITVNDYRNDLDYNFLIKQIREELFDGRSVNQIKENVYNNLTPISYKDWINRLITAGNRDYHYKVKEVFDRSDPDTVRSLGDYSIYNNSEVDDIFAEYLGIPYDKRHKFGVKIDKYGNTMINPDLSARDTSNIYTFPVYAHPVEKISLSNYTPTKGAKNVKYFRTPLSRNDSLFLVNTAKGLPVNQNTNISNPHLNAPLVHKFGTFTVGHGKDDNGEYASYFDKWDLNPFEGKFSYNDTNGDSNFLIKHYLDKMFRTPGDGSLGIGNPVHFYDRIYFNDVNYRKGGRRSLEN